MKLEEAKRLDDWLEKPGPHKLRVTISREIDSDSYRLRIFKLFHDVNERYEIFDLILPADSQ